MLTRNKKYWPQHHLFVLLVAVLALTACNQASSASGMSTPSAPAYFASAPTTPQTTTDILHGNTATSLSPTSSSTSQARSNPTSTVRPSSTLSLDEWQTLPVIPTVSQTAKEIYQRGLSWGNNRHAFSKIGDCQSITSYFLSYFDLPGYYDLGTYAALQDTIDWYAGSFSRESLAVKGGFNAAAILSPLRADPKQCKSNENPVACELRVNQPSVAIISLEEWWAGHPENYEKYMRQIIEYTISKGVVPILATKADNLEGNNLINQTIAKLAQEYDVPLWNFWAAVQDLPNHGLAAYDVNGDVDLFHLTHSDKFYFYNDPTATQSGWSMRNLTALQALDAVRRGLAEQP